MKTMMIWGAAGGIGQALLSIVQKQDDWTAVALSRHSYQLEELADFSFDADVADDHSVQNGVLATSYEVEQVDWWVYAAGDITAQKVDEMKPDKWEQILEANLTGAYRALHHSLPLLAPKAHIMFLGAVSERLKLPGLSAYVTAKMGLEAFAETLRKEQRQRNVTVVRPGAVDTPFWEKVPMRLPKDAASPQKVAQKMLEAYKSGHSGQLDLT